MRPTTGRLRFQPSRPAPSLLHQAPNERREHRHPGVRDPDDASAVDPLENGIRVKRPSRIAGRAVTFGGRWNRLWAKARLLAVADVADEPRRNGRPLPVKRARASTAEIRGSNPVSSARKSARTTLGSWRPQSLGYLVR